MNIVSEAAKELEKAGFDCGIYVNSPTATMKFNIPKPIATLEHKPTMASISVYEPIGRFKRLMLKWCFGLEYRKMGK